MDCMNSAWPCPCISTRFPPKCPMSRNPFLSPRPWFWSAQCSWLTRLPLPCASIFGPAKSGDMSCPPQVVVESLRLSFAEKEVLHGISFEIHRNEILAIIGPAQSGKTSLLRCLNRTIDFTPRVCLSGSIRVDGEDVRKTQNVYQLRRKIGMVAPLPVGLPLSIYDNVA